MDTNNLVMKLVSDTIYPTDCAKLQMDFQHDTPVISIHVKEMLSNRT